MDVWTESESGKDLMKEIEMQESASLSAEEQEWGFKDIPIQKKRRRKHHPMAVLGCVLLLVIGLIVFIHSGFFAIKKIEVTGNKQFTDQQIISWSGAEKGRNLITDARGKEIARRLKKNPYFKEVSVNRKFPSTLEITVKERKPLGAVVYGRKYIVIDENGTVLGIAETDPRVTVLEGLTISGIKEGERLKAEEKVILKNTLSMLRSMNNGDLYFKKIVISKVYIKAYVYDGLVIKGNPRLMKKMIDNGRLLRVLNHLHKEKIRRGTLTLDDENMISFSAKI